MCRLVCRLVCWLVCWLVRRLVRLVRWVIWRLVLLLRGLLLQPRSLHVRELFAGSHAHSLHRWRRRWRERLSGRCVKNKRRVTCFDRVAEGGEYQLRLKTFALLRGEVRATAGEHALCGGRRVHTISTRPEGAHHQWDVAKGSSRGGLHFRVVLAQG